MLTAQQIAQFHRDGFLIIRNVFSGGELDVLRAAADRVEAEGVAGLCIQHLYREVAGKRTYWRSEKMWDRDPIFQAVTVKPALLEAIGQCTGHPFLPINDSFVCKSPFSNVPVEWHQDPPYRISQNPSKETLAAPNFDTDIYLDDSTIENGCVWGIPAHHLVGHVDMAKLSQEELFSDFGAVPLECKPGDVVFHCLSAPHGSIGNLTPGKRRILYVHYMSRPVLEQSYTRWINDKKGFKDGAGIAYAKQMLEMRKNLGLEDLESAHLKWSQDGIEFVGQPSTPPLYWGTLAAQMSAAEIAAKKSLTFTGKRAGKLVGV